MNIGIEAISLFTSNQYIDLADIATHRNLPTDKYYNALGQYQMSVPAIDEDVITLAANAAARIINDENRDSITHVFFGTESGVDQSKSAATYIHGLLQLSPTCRAIEIKQACYGATAGIQMGLALIARDPSQKILVLASDVARYGLGTDGESSQGCGAVAILLSANPRILSISSESGFYTQDIMDFWRPNYRDEALVEGLYSSRMYLQCLEKCWQMYHTKAKRDFSNYSQFCYHTPVAKLAEKAHKLLSKLNDKNINDEEAAQQLLTGLHYSRIIGNTYTGSLYVALASLLDNTQEDLSGQRVGLFSYGSGCVAEYFSGVFVKNYQQHLFTAQHQEMLQDRSALNYEQYAKAYSAYHLPEDGSSLALPKQQTGMFRLAGIENHKRIYESFLKL
ncbi:MAG: hydroxymethylglutaryl-CoA synthase [Pseudomonadota bacterium]